MTATYLATWVHHLDPFAIQFTETFGIRWYGLAYVAGFIAAFFLIRWFVRIGASELKESQVADFITIVALFGTMIGGRLGYMLLYNFEEFTAHPLSFFDFLGGGMSSHGGIAGITLAALGYARYNKISWLSLGDSLVVVAPLGVFFGRIANFVNGELYGRVTSHTFAMKFPDELNEIVTTERGRDWMFPTEILRDLVERAGNAVPGLLEQVNAVISTAQASGADPHRSVVALVTEASQKSETFRSLLGEILNPRHPSQLYEAVIEGLIPFALLLAVRMKWKNLYQGVITGSFFILYAIGRILVENFREPDASYIAGMTRGQFYSLFMIVIGIAFLTYACVAKGRNRLPSSISSKA